MSDLRTLAFLCLIVAAFTAFLLPSSAEAGVIKLRPNNLGLVGYWSFNEGTSTLVGDFSGKGNHGTTTNIANPPTATSGWTNGKYGKGMRFDGSDDYISLASSTSISLANSSFSFSFWTRRERGLTQELLLGQDGPTPCVSSRCLTIGFDPNSGGDPNSFVFAFWGNDLRSMQRFGTDIGWHHFAGTYDASTNLRIIYVDGKQDTSDTPSNDYMGSGRLCFGGGCGGWSTTEFKGIIDEVRIYNRALGADEIKKLYEMGATSVKSPNKLGLVGHWSFDEGTSTHAGDFSGNHNDGTLTNMGDGSGKWVPGRVGKALSFDGSSNYVETTNSFTPSGVFTLSLWANLARLPSASFGAVVSTEPFSIGDNFGWWATNSGNWYFQAEGPGGNVVGTAASAIFNKWVHLVLIQDASNPYVRAYVDGVLKFTSATDPGVKTVRRLSFGRYQGGNYFPGLLDDVRIYNRALNADEVRNLYQSSQYVALNSSQDNQITNGLVGMWDFNGNHMGTTSARDSSGNNNTGWLINGPTKVAGKVGQALAFDGVDDFIGLGSAQPSVNSISLWLKLRNPVNEPILYAGNDDWNSQTWKWGIFYFSGSLFFTATSTGCGGPNCISDSPQTDTWIHYALVRNDNNAFKVYKDGALLNTNPNSGTDNDVLRMAKASTEFFNGYVDEVRAYDRALSADEIKRLYLMGR